MTGACITIPGICDLMDTMKIKIGMDSNIANDVSSAIYNLSINLGEAIGPILGGAITESFNFNSACYYTSFICFLYSLIFFIFNFYNIKSYFKKKEEFDDEYKLLKHFAEKINDDEEVYYVSKSRAYSYANKSHKASIKSL